MRRGRSVARAIASWAMLCAIAGGAGPSLAATGNDAAATPAAGSTAPIVPTLRPDGLEALVPEVAEHPLRIAPGVRPFRHRLSFSPGYGSLGSKRLYAAQVTYYPNTSLGYEWSIGHTPGQSVHAALHMVSAIVRHPFSGRFQPYASGGYGMMLVFPGQSLNAAPVTKNAFAIGGGLEIYIRGDLAVRADVRRATVLGRERDRDGIVAYDYLQQTIGLAFYRSIRP